ncbi:hypothetical protein Gotur_013567 [Gossypium turneri]
MRGKQLHTRPRWMPRHPRSGAAVKEGPSSTPTQESTPMVAPPSGQYARLILKSIILPLVYETQYSYTPMPMVLQTPLGSLFYQGGPS